jgi:threonine aldolase
MPAQVSGTASDEILNGLRRRGWKFYTFICGAARFMFSWDTSHERIDELCRDLRQCATNQAGQS